MVQDSRHEARARGRILGPFRRFCKVGSHRGVGADTRGGPLDTISLLCDKQNARQQPKAAEGVGGSPYVSFWNDGMGKQVLFDYGVSITYRFTADRVCAQIRGPSIRYGLFYRAAKEG